MFPKLTFVCEGVKEETEIIEREERERERERKGRARKKKDGKEKKERVCENIIVPIFMGKKKKR